MCTRVTRVPHRHGVEARGRAADESGSGNAVRLNHIAWVREIEQCRDLGVEEVGSRRREVALLEVASIVYPEDLLDGVEVGLV